MIQTQESKRKEEQRQRAQFDRAHMLQNEMEEPPTICMEIDDWVVQWGKKGTIYTRELDRICKEFEGHFINNGRLIVGGLE